MSTTVSSFSADGNITDSLFNTPDIILENWTSSSLDYMDNVTESVVTRQKHVTEYDIYKTAIWLYRNSWKMTAPPGLLGNIIIIIITLKMKPFNSTSLFITSLAVVDLCIICVRIAMKSLPLYTTIICQSMLYLYNAIPMLSNYILLFWTVERFIAVQFPLRVGEICTVKRTVVSIVAIGVVSFAINIAWSVSYVAPPTGIGCAIQKDKREFVYKVWYKVDASIFIFIPMIIIFLCNITIIYRLQQSTKRHQQMTSNEESRQKREKEQRNTTITLLSVSFAFLILHTPLAIYNCMAMSAAILKDQEERATWNFVNSVGLTMAEFQNSINFYLYFLTGRRYRQVTFSLFVPCRKVPETQGKSPDTTTKTTTIHSSETP